MTNIGSAQLDDPEFEAVPSTLDLHTGARSLDDPRRELKLEVAERLRMHRERRTRGRALSGEPANSSPGSQRLDHSPHSSIAAAVAQRFAQTPSYRAVLAEQARLATEQAALQAEKAAADAEVAARNASAIAASQQQLLAELELWDAPQNFTAETAQVIHAEPAAPPKPAPATPPPPSTASQAAKPTIAPNTGLTVRLYEDLGRRDPPTSPSQNQSQSRATLNDHEEARTLDEEIAFRQAPVFEPFAIEPTLPLPANLVEFPRQLVAPRKARPRAAEGPLAEESPRNPQLRIFEVEPEQISTAPEPKPTAPEWLSIRLDAQAQAEPESGPDTPPLMPSLLPPRIAPWNLRVMAEAVDCCIVGLGFVGFVAVVARIAHRLPTGLNALAAAAGTLAAFYLAYELLFFTLSDQTLGMRYARIGLCTLSDENPSRRAIRRRILAQLVAICPFGLGLLWALLDDDSLGWHDRISRMYQRAY